MTLARRLVLRRWVWAVIAVVVAGAAGVAAWAMVGTGTEARPTSEAAGSESSPMPDLGSGSGGDDAAFWSALRVAGYDAERFQTLAQQTASADAVVLGTFGVLQIDSIVQGDVASDQLTIAVSELRVMRVLAGSVPDESVTVQFAVPGTVDAARATVEGGGPVSPEGMAVVFLRDIDEEVARLRAAGNVVPEPEEPGRYRSINSLGIWAATPRSTLDTPLALEAPQAYGLYQEALAGVDDLSEFAETVAALGG